MGRSLIMHIDEAPWVHGGPSQTGTFGEQLIGDLEKGPWVLVLSIEPGHTSAPHSHDRDETIYILEGEMTFGDRLCGPGTVIHLEKETEYGFTSGPLGVRFLNVRHGAASYKARGGEWLDEQKWLQEHPA